MSQTIVYAGIDVDDVRYQCCALNQRTGEVRDLHCRPTLKGLVGQVEKLREYCSAVQMKLCYEASYVGFWFERDLKAHGYDYAVVAPSSIPRRAGKSVKTDRINAAERVEFCMKGLLTVVTAPDTQPGPGSVTIQATVGATAMCATPAYPIEGSNPRWIIHTKRGTRPSLYEWRRGSPHRAPRPSKDVQEYLLYTISYCTPLLPTSTDVL